MSQMAASQTEALLHALTGIDNTLRDQAQTAIMRLIDTNFDQLVINFFAFISPTGYAADKPTFRKLVLVLLAKYLPEGEEDRFSRLQPELQSLLQTELLKAHYEEQNTNMLTQISHCILTIAELTLYDKRWEGLIKFLFACINESTSARYAALKIIASLVDKCSTSLEEHLEDIGKAIQTSLVETHTPLQTRCQAVITACTLVGSDLVGSDLKDPARKAFSGLIPLFFNILSECVTHQEYELLNQVLLSFVEFITDRNEALFFYTHINSISEIAMTLCDKRFPDGVRQLIAQFLVSFIGGLPKQLPKSLRPAKNEIPPTIKIISTCVHVCLTLMISLPDLTPEWGSTYSSTIDDDEDDSNHEAGTFSFGSLMFLPAVNIAMITKQILPHLEKCLGSPDWKYRCAALKCYRELRGRITYGKFPFKPIVASLIDPNPRVRHCALTCFDYLCENYGSKLRTNLHQFIIPHIMNNYSFEYNADGTRNFIPRLQFAASKALHSFLENIDSTLLKNYAENILQRLMSVLQVSDPSIVDLQSETLSVIAIISGSLQEDFIPYYGIVIPILKSILFTPAYPALLQLRCKAIEAITYIGISVPVEIFYNDAKEIMQFYMSTYANTTDEQQEQFKEEDNEVEEYMLRALTRICGSLGEEFATCLPIVVPRVFNLAVPGGNNTIQYNADGTLIVKPVDIDYSNPMAQFRSNLTKSVQLLETQNAAYSILGTFASTLKSAFAPYVPRTYEILAPFVRYHQSEEVQTHAITIMPYLVESIVSSFTSPNPSLRCPFDNGIALCAEIIKNLTLACISCEDFQFKMFTIGSIYLSLGTLSDFAKEQNRENGFITSLDLEEICSNILKPVTTYDLRIEKRIEKYLNRQNKQVSQISDDFENSHLNAESIHKLNLTEEQFFDQALDSISYMAANHRVSFLYTFQKHSQLIVDMTRKMHSPQLRKSSLVILHHVFEFVFPFVTSNEDINYVTQAIRPLLEVCAERLTNDIGIGMVLERAAYALGIAATNCTFIDITLLQDMVRVLLNSYEKNKAFQLKYCNGAYVGDNAKSRGNFSIYPDLTGGSNGNGGGDDNDEEKFVEENGDEEEIYDEDEIMLSTSPEEMLQYGIDNMITAIGRIGFVLIKQGQIELASTVFTSFFSLGPVVCDIAEATLIANQLMEGVTSQNSAIMGVNGANLPNIFIFIASISSSELCEDEAKNAIRTFLKQMVQSMGNEMSMGLFNAIPSQYQQMVSSQVV